MSQNNFTLSQSNNNEDIDKLLSPIFRTIKNKKINSYFQFQNQST